MELLDEFLTFLLEHIPDPRISVSKKIKYGFRHYLIELNIDGDPESFKGLPSRGYRFIDTLEIHIDNRNCCIEIISDSGSKNIIIEDKYLVDKWSIIVEDFINKDLVEKVKFTIEKSLNECHNKSLLRDYKMKNLFKENEPLQSRRARKNK